MVRQSIHLAEPYLLGGSTIKEVHIGKYLPKDPPLSYEAGTPNIEGAIALAAAIDYLEDVQMDNVHAHDTFLVQLSLEKIRNINDLEIYGSLGEKDRLAVISFNVKGMGCHAVAKVLGLRENTMIRSGFHCTQPLHDRLGIGPSARISLYIYNTADEIETLADLLGKLA